MLVLMNKMNETPSIYDGMSNAEKEVAAYLQEIDLWWQYEQPLYVLDEKERPRVWTPDFYLPELGVYIEVCGSDKFDYEYRAKVYAKNRIPIIFVHQFKQDLNWKGYLKDKMVKIQDYRQEKVKKI
jgi:hypothetical protein